MDNDRIVYIVDDNSEICRSMKQLLSTAGLDVGCFASAQDFLDRAQDLRSGIVLIDVRMPRMNGIELLEAIQKKYRKFSCLMITGHGQIEVAVEALRKGARDFLQKPFMENALFTILKREFHLLDVILQSIRVGEEAEAKVAKLTLRESQVYEGMVQGKANKVMAHDMGISVRTIEMHRASVMDRLGCRSFAEVVGLANSARQVAAESRFGE